MPRTRGGNSSEENIGASTNSGATRASTRKNPITVGRRDRAQQLLTAAVHPCTSLGIDLNRFWV